MRRIILLITLISVLLLPVASSYAQEFDPQAPLYVRFCDRSQANFVISAITNTEAVLDQIDTLLSELDSGGITYFEGTAQAAEAIRTWEFTTQMDCLVALQADVEIALYQVLIGMIYGQNDDAENSATYLQKAQDSLTEIRTRTTASISYLQASPSATATGSAPVATRPGETLNTELQDGLTAAGITLLRNARIDFFPDGSTITIDIDALADFDNYLNVIFTFDQLAVIIADWPERPEVVRIIVQVIGSDGTTVLYVESTGDNFTQYYYDEQITQETFEAQLYKFPAE